MPLPSGISLQDQERDIVGELGARQRNRDCEPVIACIGCAPRNESTAGIRGGIGFRAVGGRQLMNRPLLIRHLSGTRPGQR
jgi:hypothetical protein